MGERRGKAGCAAMKAVKKKKKSIFLRIALLAFSVYVIVTLVQLQLQIGNEQQRLNKLDEDIQRQVSLNEDIQNKTDNYEQYLEQRARERGMARPGEVIYKEIPEN
jgi:cell division protein FtsB